MKRKYTTAAADFHVPVAAAAAHCAGLRHSHGAFRHYFSGQPVVAARWFAQGLPFAQQEVSYLNNYAVLLSELGCHAKATELIAAALQIAPQDSNLLDSEQQITQAQQAGADAVSQCRLDVVNPAAVKLRAEVE